ncbi:MAG TPA: hypothetical protein VH394_09800, partial [Thermoanaerobaculia bacterium]|nr:hypothetical protein [Thermoanaerobaculia bacterium]
SSSFALKRPSSILFVGTMVLFLGSMIASIVSVFLRTSYGVLDEMKLVNDLLTLYYGELKRLRIAFALLVAGISALVFGVGLALSNR